MHMQYQTCCIGLGGKWWVFTIPLGATSFNNSYRPRTSWLQKVTSDSYRLLCWKKVEVEWRSMIQVAPLIHSLVKQIVTAESVNLVFILSGMLLLFVVHIPLYLYWLGRIENCSLVYLADLTFLFNIMEHQKQQKSVQLMGLSSTT